MAYDAVTQAQLEERRGTDARILLWVRAKNRETGGMEVIGFWSGDDHQEFLIDGEVRTYFGAGNVISVAPLIVSPGFSVRNLRVKLPPFTDEVKTLLQTYEPRLAEVELHSCPLDIDTGAPLGQPLRRFKGFLNQAPEERQGKRGSAYTELVMVSSARVLTFTLPLKRSNAELQRRNANDRGREYIDTTAQWAVTWG